MLMPVVVLREAKARAHISSFIHSFIQPGQETRNSAKIAVTKVLL